MPSPAEITRLLEAVHASNPRLLGALLDRGLIEPQHRDAVGRFVAEKDRAEREPDDAKATRRNASEGRRAAIEDAFGKYGDEERARREADRAERERKAREEAHEADKRRIHAAWYAEP